MNGSIIFRQNFDPASSTYTYLLGDPASKEAVIIDPVMEQAERDLGLLRDLGLTLKYTIETHVHADHISGATLLKDATGAQSVVGYGSEVECADILIKDGESLKFGAYGLQAIHTPGHTASSFSFAVTDMVFTGDTLLIRGTGRTDFQGGAPEALYDSIVGKLFWLPEDTRVFPGHDYHGLTVSTIGEEKRLNPRAGNGRSKEEFVEIMNSLDLAEPKRIDVSVKANRQCGRI